MTDRAFEPPADNVFDQAADPGQVTAPAARPNRFDKYDPDQGGSVPAPQASAEARPNRFDKA